MVAAAMTRHPELNPPYLQDPDFTLHVGDVLDVLPQLEPNSVDCVITSPPYWGLRDYGTGSWDGGKPDCDHMAGKADSGFGDVRESELSRRYPSRDVCGRCGATRQDHQLGLEPTPDAYVQNMVAVFRHVRRVLAPHGTCWVNLGDSYIAGQGGRQSAVGEMPAAPLAKVGVPRRRDDVDTGSWADRDLTAKMTPARGTTDLKPKDLAGIPWMVAFALRADGWYLRSDIIWAKPNPMPESVTDRPTKAHEYVFLLTKQPRYWFDAEAVREPHTEPWRSTGQPERGEANRERKIAQVKARYQADAERIKTHKREYRAQRPIEIRVLNANWRARQLGIPGTLTTETVKGRLELWGWRCWRCGAPWEELDHVLPLARGGLNLPANIRPSCGRCNKAQAARLMNETLGVISGR